MQRAWSEIEKADRILVLADSEAVKASNTQTLTLNDLLPPESNQQLPLNVDKITVIFNKIDLLPQNTPLPTIAGIDSKPLALSAKKGLGIDELTQHLKTIMGYEQTGEGGFTARRRHLEALEAALKSIDNARDQLSL